MEDSAQFIVPEPRWQLGKFVKAPDPRPFWVKIARPHRQEALRLLVYGRERIEVGEKLNAGSYQTNVLDPVRRDGSCLVVDSGDVEMLGGGFAAEFLRVEDPQPDGRLLR